MSTPDFVLELRSRIGHELLWLPGVTAVVVREEPTRVLLVKRADNGEWTPVTGIVDPGEQPAVAGAREVLEEAGVVAEPARLASIGVSDIVTYPNGDRSQYLDLTFRFRYVDGEPYPADGENTQAAWFAPDAFPPMSETMRERTLAALSDQPAAAFAR